MNALVKHQTSTQCLTAFAGRVISFLKQCDAVDAAQGVDIPRTRTSPPTTSPDCSGFAIHWPLGSPYKTYPFAIHDPGSPNLPAYTVELVDTHASTITIRSTLCNRTRPHGASACISCQRATSLCEAVLKAATPNLSLRGADYSSHSQLLERIQKVKANEKKGLNNQTNLDRLREKSGTWDSILNLVGTQVVPGLHRVFRNHLEFGWSIEKLLEQLKAAGAGTYHPKNYSKLEIDLATAVYELGGGGALHALHHSPFAFPGRATLIQHRRNFRLRVSIGDVTMTDLLANIETMFKDYKSGSKRVGIVLSMDEVASDGRLCYLSETDCIAGLCEHAADLPDVKMGEDLNVMRAVAEAVRSGKVHVGQEVLVAAFSRLDDMDYGARPVLLLPTCKRGTYKDSALLIEMLRQAWKMSPYGECLHGPLFSIASDGDPKRRPALYLHCMVRELQPSDDLYALVRNLPGLNLFVGKDLETQDLDYRHGFKRICKLVCTREGLFVDDVVINKSLLAHWFEYLTDVDWSEDSIYSLLNVGVQESSDRIQSLLSPKDPQDVPRAIKLLTLISDLHALDASIFNPSERQTHRSDLLPRGLQAEKLGFAGWCAPASRIFCIGIFSLSL